MQLLKYRMESSDLRVNNTSGVTNIYYCKANAGWQVRLPAKNGKKQYLGTYPTIAEAKKALDAQKRLTPENTTNTKEKYISYIKANGLYYFQKKSDGGNYLRSFKTLEEAVVARDNYLRMKALTSQTTQPTTTSTTSKLATNPVQNILCYQF